MTERDPKFEAEMLDLAIETAGKVYHAEPAHFAREVQARLARGAERHPGYYHTRDCLAEAFEEPTDAVAWHLLDLQKARGRLSEDDFQQLRMTAAAAMGASAAAFAALQQYRELRDELL